MLVCMTVSQKWHPSTNFSTIDYKAKSKAKLFLEATKLVLTFPYLR